MMEVYANAVVAELNTKLGGLGDIAIFGGTANGGWNALARDGKLPSPSILVKEFYDAPKEQTTYAVKAKNGSTSISYCTPDVFAFMYGIEFHVFASDQSEVEKTARELVDACKDGVMIDVEIEGLSGEVVPLFFKVEEQDIDVENLSEQNGFRQSGYLARLRTTPEKTPKPFFYNLANNVWADMGGYEQYDLLVAARNCISRYWLTGKISYDTGLRRFLAGETSFCDKETKKNTRSYAEGGPVDRQWFNAKFKKSIILCPDVFERAMRRDSLEDIQSHAEDLKKQYDAKFDEFCNALGIPETYGSVEWWQPRTFRAFDLYIEVMDGDRFQMMDQVFKAYKERVAEEEAIQERKHAEEAMAAGRAGDYADDLFDNILGTAIGTAGLLRQQKKQNAELRKQTRIMEEEQKARQRREMDEWFRRFHNGEDTGRFPT